MSTINNLNSQNALTILNQSSGSIQTGTAGQAGARSAAFSAKRPTDTVTLSDQAKSHLAAGNADGALSSVRQLTTSVANSSTSNKPQSGVDIQVQLLQQQAAAEGGTATVQNANDVAGLGFQENVQGTPGASVGSGTQVSVNFNSHAFQSNPNNVIVFDSNPADAKLVTV